MSIIKNGKNIIGVYKGYTPISKIFKHNNLVYQLSSTGGTETPYDITSTFNITSTISPTVLCYSSATSAFTEMYVDGVQIDVASGYTFNTTGEHTVNYMLADKTKIGINAFYKCSALTLVNIFDSVTTIDSSAFNGCSGLTEIVIPDSVTTIGSKAFYNCSGLTSIDIPSSVTNIGTQAFYSTQFYNNLPNGYVYLGSCYYKYKGTMPRNTSITIKDGTKSISPDAFNGCSGLTSVTIPSSITSIGGSAFYGCKSLKAITIPQNFSSNIESSTFAGCTSLTEIIIPDSVPSISGSDVFSGCTSLQKITIGSGVTSIGTNSGFIAKSIFTGCTSLREITCLAPIAPTLLKKSIQGVENNGGTLYVPQGSDYSTWKAILTSWTIQYI